MFYHVRTNKQSNPEGAYCFPLGRNNLNHHGQSKLAAQKELKNFSQKKPTKEVDLQSECGFCLGKKM